MIGEIGSPVMASIVSSENMSSTTEQSSMPWVRSFPCISSSAHTYPRLSVKFSNVHQNLLTAGITVSYVAGNGDWFMRPWAVCNGLCN
jgi:hypothetical protein